MSGNNLIGIGASAKNGSRGVKTLSALGGRSSLSGSRTGRGSSASGHDHTTFVVPLPATGRVAHTAQRGIRKSAVDGIGVRRYLSPKSSLFA
jgi:hypothetical protein